MLTQLATPGLGPRSLDFELKHDALLTELSLPPSLYHIPANLRNLCVSGGRCAMEAVEFPHVRVTAPGSMEVWEGPGDGEGGAMPMLRWASWSSRLGAAASLCLDSFSPKSQTHSQKRYHSVSYLVHLSSQTHTQDSFDNHVIKFL